MKLNNIKILLIEDSNFDARIIKDMLEKTHGIEHLKLNFQIIWAKTLEEGKRKLSKDFYDVILLDLTLPDSIGLNTLKSVYTDSPEAPIIVLTGLNDQSIAIRAVREGAQDYLVKGQFTMDLLLRSIHYSIERHKMLMALRSMALIDQLTGLYNRHGFLSLAKHHMKLSNRKGTNLLLVYCDLDYLKYINDNFGHNEGDRVLKEVGSILREAFRESDIISRFGGDEFVILAIGVKEEDKDSIIERLQSNIDFHNKSIERAYEISVSTGAVFYNPNTHREIEDVLNEADNRMYKNKREKKNNNKYPEGFVK